MMKPSRLDRLNRFSTWLTYLHLSNVIILRVPLALQRRASESIKHSTRDTRLQCNPIMGSASGMLSKRRFLHLWKPQECEPAHHQNPFIKEQETHVHLSINERFVPCASSSVPSVSAVPNRTSLTLSSDEGMFYRVVSPIQRLTDFRTVIIASDPCQSRTRSTK